MATNPLPNANLDVLGADGKFTLPWRRWFQSLTGAGGSGGGSVGPEGPPGPAGPAGPAGPSGSNDPNVFDLLAISSLDQSGAGGFSLSSSNQSSSFTTSAAFNVYYLDTSGGAYTVTLDASPSPNEVVEVWDSTGHAGANPVSFSGNGNNIAGAASVTNFIAINYGHARLIFNGTQWLAQ